MFNDGAIAKFELCGADPASVPIATLTNYQMILDRFLPLDMLPSLLYTMNMVNSDMVSKLECLGVAINPYMGLWL